jgi:hypothetical protein
MKSANLLWNVCVVLKSLKIEPYVAKLKRKTPRAERGAFLSCFFFPSYLFFCFSLFFETPLFKK